MSTEMKEISELSEGSIIVIEDKPCKIVKMSTSMPGKHGHVKYSVQTVGIFDGRKRNLTEPSDAKVEVPAVERSDAQVLNIMGNDAQLMDLSSYEIFEISIPEDLRGKLEEGDEVEYIKAMGRKKIDRRKD